LVFVAVGWGSDVIGAMGDEVPRNPAVRRLRPWAALLPGVLALAPCLGVMMAGPTASPNGGIARQTAAQPIAVDGAQRGSTGSTGVELGRVWPIGKKFPLESRIFHNISSC
jgi:hypothetical protein